MTPLPPSRPELRPEEARVLGCLLEKSVTTPDHYPLSLNALVTACNQTTNRDPVVHYDDDTVEAALATLRELGLATRGKAPGERAIKHRHRAGDTLGLDAAGLALVGVLLLRGAQTVGELKGRTERWHDFGGLDAVESVLAALADRGFVRRLERRPGQKEARWVQLLAPLAAEPEMEAPGAGTSVGSVGGSEAPGAPAGAAPGASPSLEVRDPSDDTVLREIAADGEAEVAAKVARARAAQRAWAAAGVGARIERLTAFGALLAEELDDFAATTTAETGKPITQARNEVRAVLDRIDWYLDHVPALLEAEEVSDDGRMVERVTYDPVGVVAHVSAWNYPYFVGLNSIVPALLCGNAVLYKPSEHATLTGLAIVDALHRSGVPVDVMQAVVGAGHAGAALVAAEGVDMVCFTGSYDTGLKIARAGAARLARVQLELGGKDAAYVTDDVDLDATAEAVAEGIFYNAGQSCCAIERVYVHESVHDAFVERLVAATAAQWRPGDPRDPATTMGPLARSEQCDLLEQQVADATARGARVVLDGGRLDRPGNWFAPMVLTEVDHAMAIMRDESFGPVIGVMRVRDDRDAIARMNDTDYGLTGAVYARDRSRAEALLAQLDTGSVYWNCSDRTSVRLPWAGRRRSGLGVSMAPAGIRTFLRERAWHLRRA